MPHPHAGGASPPDPGASIADRASEAQSEQVDVEFVDESAADDAVSDDLLDARARRRAPRWLAGLACAAAAVAAIAVVVHRQPLPDPVAAPPSTSVGPVVPAPLTALDETFADIYLRASDPAPAEDIVRSGSDISTCEGVRIGAVPQHDAVGALRRALPGFVVKDTARIIDGDAGLCALQVRAQSRAGTVAVIMVSSRSPESTVRRPRLMEDDRVVLNNLTVQFARLRTADGWIVVAGSSGPRYDAPALGALTELAGSPALRW